MSLDLSVVRFELTQLLSQLDLQSASILAELAITTREWEAIGYDVGKLWSQMPDAETARKLRLICDVTTELGSQTGDVQYCAVKLGQIRGERAVEWSERVRREMANDFEYRRVPLA